MDYLQFHSLAYVKACEDQRMAARTHAQFVRDGLPLLGEPYRLDSERLAGEIWVHLNWLRENGHDRAYRKKAA